MSDLFRGWSHDDLELFATFTAGLQSAPPGSTEARATLIGLQAVAVLVGRQQAEARQGLKRMEIARNESLPHLSERVSSEIAAELMRAEQLHPRWPTDALHAAAIIGEEAGEVTKAVLQRTYQPAEPDHPEGREEIRKEVIQLAAMTIRFLAHLDRGRLQFTPRFEVHS